MVRLRRPMIRRGDIPTPLTGGCLRQPRRFFLCFLMLRIMVRLRRPMIRRGGIPTPFTGGCLRQPRRFFLCFLMLRIMVRLRRPMIRRGGHPNPFHRRLPSSATPVFSLTLMPASRQRCQRKTGYRLRDAGERGWVEDRIRTGDLQSHNLAL